MSTEKTHYRKAFDSPYLSAADIVEPTVLTVRCVKLEKDKTKKAELLVRVKSLQVELEAKQVEKALLARTTEIRKGEESRGLWGELTRARQVKVDPPAAVPLKGDLQALRVKLGAPAMLHVLLALADGDKH